MAVVIDCGALMKRYPTIELIDLEQRLVDQRPDPDSTVTSASSTRPRCSKPWRCRPESAQGEQVAACRAPKR